VAGLRTLAAVYALGVVPGYVVQRHLFRLHLGGPFEILASSLLLGTLITPLLWYGLSCAGLSAVFYPLAFALAVGLPFARGWHRQAGLRLSRLVVPSESAIFWVALGLAVLWTSRFDLAAVQGDRVVIQPHDDHLFHVALVAELARGVPPSKVPFMACVDKLGYHLMPDVWCDMIRRMAGVDAMQAYFYLAQPLCYVFLCFACYLAMVRRFGRMAATVGAVCLLGFAGYHNSRCLFTNWLLTYLHSSYPSMFGLMGTFLILYYASTLDVQQPRGSLLAMSILSVLLLWYKANFALVVAPAVAVLCVVVLARKRDYGWMAVCVGAQTLLTTVHYLTNSSADYRPTLAFAPFGFIRHLWWQGTQWLKELDGPWWVLAGRSALNGIRWRVESLPESLKWPVIYLLCVVYLFHWGLVVVPYAAVRCGFGRLRSPARAFDLLTLLLLSGALVGLVLFPIEPRCVWNISKHVLALVYALVFALMGPVVCDLVWHILRRGKPVITLAAPLLLVVFAANAYALCHRTLWNTAFARQVVPRDHYECYRYIQRCTSPDATILQPRFYRGPFASGLTQRRAVMDCALGFDWTPPIRRTLSEMEAFYSGTDPGAALRMLRRYGVDNVIADRSLVSSAGYGGFLSEAFRSGTMAVFRVEPEGGEPAPHASGTARS